MDKEIVKSKFNKYGVSFELIKNKDLQNALIDYFVNIVPNYFWVVPASSTGKYHPDYASGEEGLLRHTCAAVRIAADIVNLAQYTGILDEVDKDCIIAALMLHDTFKHGKEVEKHYNNYSVHEHPLISAEMVNEHLLHKYNKQIANNIKSHMGQWNINKYSKYILPIPSTIDEQLVHLCDYLASRKYLEFKF